SRPLLITPDEHGTFQPIPRRPPVPTQFPWEGPCLPIGHKREHLQGSHGRPDGREGRPPRNRVLQGGSSRHPVRISTSCERSGCAVPCLRERKQATPEQAGRDQSP